MIEWSPMRDDLRVSGVYSLRWWRDPHGRAYLVHTHGSGSVGGDGLWEVAVSGRDLLTGRRLEVLLERERSAPTARAPGPGDNLCDDGGERVLEHRTRWTYGSPHPTWSDVQRLTGIRPKTERGGYTALEDPHHDALHCHPVAIAAYELMTELDLPAHGLTCPECCMERRLTEYARQNAAENVGDVADGTVPDPRRRESDSRRSEGLVYPAAAPIEPVVAWRAVFEEIATTERFCRHAATRWNLEEAWDRSGWPAGAQRLPAALARVAARLECQRRGEMDADGQTKLTLA